MCCPGTDGHLFDIDDGAWCHANHKEKGVRVNMSAPFLAPLAHDREQGTSGILRCRVEIVAVEDLEVIHTLRSRFKSKLGVLASESAIILKS